MPTPLTHGLVGLTLTQLVPQGLPKARCAVLLTALAAAPDVDVLGFLLGIRYADVLGHRGLTHSMVIALGAALLVTAAGLHAHQKRLRSFLPLLVLAMISAVSHGLLDAVTDGGLGVALWLPFSAQRYFFAYRPIRVSPLNPTRLLAGAAPVLASEATWIWTHLLLLSCAVRLCRHLSRRREPPGRPCDTPPPRRQSGSASPRKRECSRAGSPQKR